MFQQTTKSPFKRPLGFAVVALSVFVTASHSAHAQSGTRTTRPKAKPPARAAAGGSQSRTAPATVALDGYCAVCVIEMKKWVPGKPEYQVTYDGKTYLFPNEEQKQMFVSDPAKYTPAMGGDCTVCSVKMGQTMPGKVQFPVLYGNRLFLFPGEEQKREFLQSPETYANVDLAFDGKCSVCRVEMNQEIQGDPGIATVYQGMRYLFPGDEQRQMFLANPAKYAVPSGRTGK